jgi:hypothetical protein
MQLRRMAGTSLCRVDLLGRVALGFIVCLGAMLLLADPALGGTQQLSDPQVRQFTPRGIRAGARVIRGRGNPRAYWRPYPHR